MSEGAENLRHKKRDDNNTELGPKSIFYDPEWNVKGEALPGFRNIPYNPATFSRKDEATKPQLAGLTNIPRPEK